MQRLLILFLAVFLPIAGLSQSVPIVDAGYLTNVQGTSNFVKNPNAQKNVANVTSDDSSTITRSTTTALSATSEFNLTDAGAWSAVFAARTFDSGMNGRQCEARVTVRGVAGTATLTVLDGTTVIGSVDVVPNATTSVVPTVYFPCGAPTTPKLKLSGSTAVTGTLEFGAAYVGPAFSTSAGTISTEPVTYTPTLNSTTNVLRNSAKWQRVGPAAIISGEISWNGTGAATPLTITLPSGLTADTARLPTTVNARIGDMTWNGATLAQGEVIYNVAGNVIYFTVQGASGVFVSSSALNAHVITYDIKVPISGWSATDIVTPEASLQTTGSINTGYAAWVPAVGEYGDRTSVTLSESGIYTLSAVLYTVNSGALTGATLLRAGLGTVSGNNAANLGAEPSITNAGSDTLRYAITVPSTTVTVTSTPITVYLKNRSDSYTTNLQAAGYIFYTKAPNSNQSFYISSPLKAAPDGSGVKVKSTTNVDIATATDAGVWTFPTFSIFGTSAKTTNHNLDVLSDDTAAAGITFTHEAAAKAYIDIAGTTAGNRAISGTPEHALEIRSEAGTYFGSGTINVGGYNTSGAWRWGPAGSDIVVHDLNGYLRIKRAVTGTSHTMMQFLDGANDVAGAIEINAVANTTTYVTTSDARKKADLGAFSALGLVNKMKIHNFKWKHASESPAEVGIYAQELQPLVPYAVMNNKADDYWGVDYGRLSPIALKAIQEQQVQIECLVNADSKKERQACIGVK